MSSLLDKIRGIRTHQNVIGADAYRTHISDISSLSMWLEHGWLCNLSVKTYVDVERPGSSSTVSHLHHEV